LTNDPEALDAEDEADGLYAIARQYQLKSPGADMDAIEVNLGVYRASEAFKLAVNRYVEVHGLGISRSRYSILRTLYFAEGPLAQHEVGRILGVSRMNVTKLLDGLEKDGLVVRTSHPTDRRVTLAQLTPAGEALSSMLLPLVAEFMGDMLRGFTTEEKRTFKRLLRRFWWELSASAETTAAEPAVEADAPG
jgi:DNA-binding MarR family transcriptional regulator